MMGAVWQDVREDGMASTHFYPPPKPEKGLPSISTRMVYAFYLQTTTKKTPQVTLQGSDKMSNMMLSKTLKNSITLWAYV